MSEPIQPTEPIDVKGKPTQVTIKPEIPTSLQQLKTETFKEKFDSFGKIQIKPFLDRTKSNMGLENYGMVLFPNVYYEEQLAAIERNGVVRYITGLDEFAPEVQNIKDGEQKQAVITNIRTIVAHLEKMLATNVLDINDSQFWNKVTLLQPTNIKFWGSITLRVGNDPVTLEPNNDPYDLIKLMGIEAGGFSGIAKSYEDALALPVLPKFYLDKEVHSVSVKANYKKIRNKAISLLDALLQKDARKLLYITKIIDVNSSRYNYRTPTDILYDALDEYINGNGVEGNKLRAAEYFTNISKLDSETLKLRAIAKDAIFYRHIVAKPDGMMYHAKTAAVMGRNLSDVVMYLKNPLNEDVLVKIITDIEAYWSK